MTFCTVYFTWIFSYTGWLCCLGSMIVLQNVGVPECNLAESGNHTYWDGKPENSFVRDTRKQGFAIRFDDCQSYK